MTYHDMIDLGLNEGAALSAFIAGGFWFASAAGKMPNPDTTYAGFIEVPGKIIAALDYSAKRNRTAALFSGISAFLMAAAIVLGLCPLISN